MRERWTGERVVFCEGLAKIVDPRFAGGSAERNHVCGAVF